MRRWILLLLLVMPSFVRAQHTRIYAVVVGNDDPANSMAGSSLGSGLWQSDDTGRTWKQLGWKHIKAFSMDHDSSGRVLYLAAGNGVLKSTDFGESWKVMTDWRVAEVMDVMIHPKDAKMIFAATAHGVIKSTDAGVTWKPAHKGITQPYTSRIYSFNDVLYVCSEDGLYQSRDEGRSWKLVRGSPGAIRAAAKSNGQVIFVGDSSIADTEPHTEVDNVGKSESALWDISYWTQRGAFLVAGQHGVAISSFNDSIHFSGPKNVHALATIGTHIIAGTLGEGLYISDDLIEWKSLGMPKSQVWSIKPALVK